MADTFKDFVVAQLSELEGVQARSMFGGHGLYLGNAFFGIVYKSRLYLHTTADSRKAYEDRGMPAFRPFGSAAKKLAAYYEVPPDAIADAPTLLSWAREAAQNSAGKKRKSKKA